MATVQTESNLKMMASKLLSDSKTDRQRILAQLSVEEVSVVQVYMDMLMVERKLINLGHRLGAA